MRLIISSANGAFSAAPDTQYFSQYSLTCSCFILKHDFRNASWLLLHKLTETKKRHNVFSFHDDHAVFYRFFRDLRKLQWIETLDELLSGFPAFFLLFFI